MNEREINRNLAEKITDHIKGFNIRYLVASVGWVTLGQLFTMFTAFAVLVFLANILPKEVYGEYRFVISLILILIVFALSGMNVALPQSVARGKHGNLRGVTQKRVKYGLIGSFFALVIAVYFYVIDGNTRLSSTFLIVAILLPFFNAYFNFFPYFQGRKMFARSALYHAVGRAVFAVAIVGIALVTSELLILIASFMVLTILTQYVPYRIAIKDDELQKEELDEELVGYSKELTILGMPSFIAGNLDKVIIGFFLGPVQVASYFVATTFSMESSRVGRIIAQALLPKMSESESINVRTFFKNLLLLEMVLVICWLLYALSADLIFTVLFSDYKEVVSMSVVAMLALLFAPIYVIRSLFIARKERKKLRYMITYTPIVQIALLIILTPMFGVWGAIFGVLTGLFLEFVLGVTLLLSGSAK